MSLTNFPNGVSAQASSAVNASAGAGDLDCSNLYVSGTASFGTVLQDVLSVNIAFGTSSAAQIYGCATPNFASDLIGAIVTIGSVSAIAAAYTVQGGSAGTVHVSSESNTITNAYANQALTIDSATLTTTNGLKITRGTQGTAGDSYLTLLFKRTAA